MKNRVIIIGAGAAGMMAALSAQENGADVTILERNDRVGRKLLATGNGRCNFTNINASIENYYGENEKFAYSAFSQFDVYQTMYFFEGLGITPKVEPRGKVFPASLQSSSMLDIFLYEIRKRKIRLELNTYVKEVYKMDDFKIRTLEGKVYSADRLIIATGGRSLANTGSDGNGYRLAKNLGHEITDTFPGIVQLHLDDRKLKEKSGVRIYGRAELYIDGEFIRDDEDDILFTDYGISGPTILQLSRQAIGALREDRLVEIKVVMIIDKKEEEVFDYLTRRFLGLGEKTLEEALIGYINKKLILPVIGAAGLEARKLVAEMTKEEIRSLSAILTGWSFRVSGHQPWEFAQVTAGGVRTKDVRGKNLESKIIEGLYFAGEILDVDGDCGGYNLQWAWSSGYVAGMDAAIS